MGWCGGEMHNIFFTAVKCFLGRKDECFLIVLHIVFLGLGCSTVLFPEAAALFAAQIFGQFDHLVWAKLRANILSTWISLKQADKQLRNQ